MYIYICAHKMERERERDLQERARAYVRACMRQEL